MNNASSRSRFLCALRFLCLLLALPSPAAPAPPNLNLILIVADDLGAHDLGVTGSRFHQTPNLDRLAASGVRFTRAYSACTVCSPTRAAIQTGQHPARLKITDWIKGHAAPKAKLLPPSNWNQQLALEHVTLAERLAERGYSTAHLGKWHLGGDGFEPEKQGFALNLGGDHRGQPPSYFSPYGLPKLPDGPPGEYLTDREGAEAARFIAAHRDRPFFLHYAPYSVHTPLQAPSNLVARFSAKTGPAGSFQTNATYAAMLERLDAAVGRILDTLAQFELSRHTVVLFTSDNGGLVLGKNPPTSNAPLRSGKGSPYEGGVRIPLLVSWPGVTPPGSTCDVPVQSIDLLPTLVALAGSPSPSPAPTPSPPPRVDGLSLVPLLREPASATLERDALFWHYPHYHPGGATPYAAVRTGPWKLIQYYETGRPEIFNLETDPSESTNLADTETNRVMQLSRRLFDWQNSVGAQWPMPNPNWTPARLDPLPDGSIVLHSRHAFVHSTLLRYEPQPFKDTLGWWARPDDWASWDFHAPESRRYAIDILQGCGKGSGGSTVDFKVAGKTITMTVLDTGHFQNFTHRTIGEIEVPAGPHTLEVRPVTKPGGAVMDLRQVVLRPLPEPAR